MTRSTGPVNSFAVARRVVASTMLAAFAVPIASCSPTDDNSTKTDAGGASQIVVADSSLVDFPAALLSGTLRREGPNGTACVYLDFESESSFVVWPYGTTWDDENQGVLLPPNGRLFRIGDSVVFGGGALAAGSLPQILSTEMATLLEQCAPKNGSVLVATST